MKKKMVILLQRNGTITIRIPTLKLLDQEWGGWIGKRQEFYPQINHVSFPIPNMKNCTSTSK